MITFFGQKKGQFARQMYPTLSPIYQHKSTWRWALLLMKIIVKIKKKKSLKMFSHVSHVAQDHTRAEQFIQHWALLTPATTLRSATCSWVMLRFDVPPPCATMVVPPVHHIVPSRFATMVVPPAYQPWCATTLYHHSLCHHIVPLQFSTTLCHLGLPPQVVPQHIMPPRFATRLWPAHE